VVGLHVKQLKDRSAHMVLDMSDCWTGLLRATHSNGWHFTQWHSLIWSPMTIAL